MFGQGAYEVFCETWERFKTILRKFPNHGFEDIAQLSIFLNGLEFDIQMLLDAVAGDTMMAFDVEQATRIIDALTLTNYQAPHDRQDIQKLLSQNKILTSRLSN